MIPRHTLLLIALLVAACGGGDTTGPGSSTPVASLTFSLGLERDTVLVRETFDATVRLTDAGGAVLADRPVTWTSSDSSVLGISRGGVVTALHAGTATLTATSGTATASRALTVRALRFVDVDVGPSVTCGREADGQIWCWGQVPATGFGNGSAKSVVSLVPRRAAAGHHFSALSVGPDFACGIEDGRVLCWGANASGQLGDGTTSPHFSPAPVAGLPAATAIAAGDNAGAAFACALVGGGEVYCWGDNSSGELGDGTRTTRSTPAPVVGLSGASAIAAASAHACALVGSAASCWGNDYQGQLGHDTTYDRLTPVRGGTGPGVPPAWSAVGADEWHTCALTTAGAAWCWGTYNTGVFDGWDVNAEFPTPQAAGHQFIRLADGGRVQCGLEAAGDVWCWIYGHAPTRFPSAVPFTDVVVSWRGVCALDVNGVVRCMNGPAAGDPVAVSGAPPLVRLAADDGSACGLTAAGAVWCWGGGDAQSASAQLVSGTTAFSSIWSGGYAVCALTAAGDAWCRSNHNSPADLVAEPAGYSLAAVAKGFRVTCGVTTAGAALCWSGSNANGQLGDGTRTSHTTPAPVSGGITFTSIAVGDNHACGVTSAATLYCWGEGYNGAIGDGTIPMGKVPVPVSGNHAFTALAGDAGGDVMCGLGSGGVAVCWPNADKVVAGAAFTHLSAGGQPCGLDASGAASCFTAAGGTWSVAPVPSSPQFVAISGGGTTTCGITQAGGTWCWGTNYFGNLGSPDARALTTSAVPVKVYGSE